MIEDSLMIRAHDLSFGFPQRELFQHLCFSLETGRHCALIGSNGSGKTSLARLLLEPERFTYEGTLRLETAGRVGFVRQFLQREEGEAACTVRQYLMADFDRLQQELESVCRELETAEEPEPLLERYQQLLDESQAMDADSCESSIARRLYQAGLTDKAELRLEQLSGGEYKLVQIIRQMLRRPALLVMDEPDVFLDFDNLAALAELIEHYPDTLLVVTHSRWLLNHCFDKIWHLENGTLAEYDGSFPAYDHYRLQAKLDRQIASRADAREVQRLETLVERLRDDATQVISPQKGRVLKGKVSQLNRMLARQSHAPYIEVRQPDIALPRAELVRGEEPLLAVEGLTLGFDGKPLLEDVSFSLLPGEKVALVGPNGSGKSTLLRAIRQGCPQVRLAPGVRMKQFSQLHQEVFFGEGAVWDTFFEAGLSTKGEIAAHLEKYGFAPEQLGQRVEQLSGGERNLLQLALLELGEADVLLLDEPSSHLDTFAQRALEEALAHWPGAVLMVSHDYYTVARCAQRVLLAEEGTVRPMSPRAFRKRIYRRHFDRELLLLEQQKQELESRITQCLLAEDCARAQELCDRLGDIVDQME